MARTYIVAVTWDGAASMWVATSDDVPGLVTEARTVDALVERVRAVTPQLLDDNAHLIEGGRSEVEEIDIHIIARLGGDPAHA